MKKIALIATLFALLTVRSDAQTLGGGVSVTGTTNVPAQVSVGVYLTNSLYAYNPQRTVTISNVNTNQNIISWYSFQVPTNWVLVSGYTNLYVTGYLTNSMAGATQGGTTNITVQGVSTLVTLPGWMGINVGAYTNTITVIP
jgi:hypothetical protein